MSGGVSLGAWQAGATWSVVELLKRQDRVRSWLATWAPDGKDPSFELTAVSGASAGNTNAVLAALQYCAEPGGEAPEKSLFYRIWTSIGWDRLNNTDTTDQGKGILSRSAFRNTWDMLVARVDTFNADHHSDRPACSIPVGLATTRHSADTLRVSPNAELTARVQRTVGIFQLRYDPSPQRSLPLGFYQPDAAIANERSLGRAKLLPSAGRNPVPLSPLSLVNADDLRRLMYASAAFPVALGPVQLRLYPPSCLVSTTHCEDELDRAYYVDGGVFDNQTIGAGLAMDKGRSDGLGPRARQSELTRLVAEWVLCSGGTDQVKRTLSNHFSAATVDSLLPDSMQSRGADDPRCHSLLDSIKAVKRPPLGHVHAMYIDDGIFRGAMKLWTPIDRKPARAPTSPLNTSASLIGTAAGTARQYELAVLGRSLTAHSDTTLTTTTRALPLVADGFAHFGAFFGSAFRMHDFYVGLYDGLLYASQELFCGNVRRTGCADSVLYHVLTDGTVNLDCTGRIVLATLHSEEARNRGDQWISDSAVVPAGCRATGSKVSADTRAMIDRGRVLSDLAGATYEAAEMVARRAEADEPSDCPLRSLFDAPYCAANFDYLLSRWRDALRRDGLPPRNDCPDTTAVTAFDKALGSADVLQCRLIQNPYAAYHESIATLLYRLQNGEDGLLRHTISTVAYLDQASTVAFEEGRRYGNPAIIHPEWKNCCGFALRWLAPYSVEWTGHRDLTLGWRPFAAGVSGWLGATWKFEADWEYRFTASDTRAWTRDLLSLGIGGAMTPSMPIVNSIHLVGYKNLTDGEQLKLTAVLLGDLVLVGSRIDYTRLAPRGVPVYVLGCGDVSVVVGEVFRYLGGKFGGK